MSLMKQDWFVYLNLIPGKITLQHCFVTLRWTVHFERRSIKTPLCISRLNILLSSHFDFFFPKVNSLSRKGRQRALPYVERDSTSRSHSSIIVRIARFAFVTSVSKRVTLITPK